MRNGTLLAAIVVASGTLCSHAMAQDFVNGNFATGDLTGWTVTPTFNGLTTVQDVAFVDIDGPGPLEPANAGRFNVGNIAVISGHQAGIDLFQGLNLSANTVYHVSFNWSAQRGSATNNAEGGVFTFLVDGKTYNSQAAGSTSSTTPKYGFLTGEFSTTAAGSYDVGVRITRPFTAGAGTVDLFQYVDNFEITPVVGGACCMDDGSCVLATGTRCTELGGIYNGDNTLCTGQCPQPGACCVPTGCTVVSEAQCNAIFGVYQGNGTTCAGSSCPPASVEHLVLPNSREFVNGGSTNNYIAAEAGRTLQIAFDRSQVPIEIGSELTGITWRVSSSATLQTWPEFDAQYGSFEIEISTLAGSIPEMSVIFANNVGSNATIVHQGPLTIPAFSFPAGIPAPGVNDWGHFIPFTTPFVYNGGNLLITIRHEGHTGGSVRTFDAVATSNTGLGYGSLVRAVGATNTSAINGTAQAAPVTYIAFTPAGAGPCYANCDGSTTAPILNVDDFTCFINEFASAQNLPHAQQVTHYANCDGSTTAPALNVDDFTCFINAFATGCP